MRGVPVGRRLDPVPVNNAIPIGDLGTDVLSPPNLPTFFSGRKQATGEEGNGCCGASQSTRSGNSVRGPQGNHQVSSRSGQSGPYGMRKAVK